MKGIVTFLSCACIATTAFATTYAKQMQWPRPIVGNLALYSGKLTFINQTASTFRFISDMPVSGGSISYRGSPTIPPFGSVTCLINGIPAKGTTKYVDSMFGATIVFSYNENNMGSRDNNYGYTETTTNTSATLYIQDRLLK